MKEIDLTYLMELAERGLDNRMRVLLQRMHQTYKWIPLNTIRENGWPGTLELIKEHCLQHKIRLKGLPDSP